LPPDIPSNPNSVYKDNGWIGMGDWLGTGTIASFLREYRSFTEARTFVHRLGLNGVAEWRAFTKSGKLPPDIPADPSQVYKDKGWVSMGDWFGTGTIATFFREYRSFLEARTFVRSLKLKNGNEWKAFTKSGKLPPDIPAKPDSAYKDKGWVGMGDWLGTGTISPFLREYRPFKDARAYAHRLSLNSSTEWREFAKSGELPSDIPADPGKIYKDKGWSNWGDWLGTGTIATFLRDYRPFKEARTFAQSLKLNNGKEWRVFSKTAELPPDIPSNPNSVYKDKGWVGMGDWLGTGNVRPGSIKYRSFTKARTFAQGLKLKNQKEWFAFIKSGELPLDIPSNPHTVYRDKGWTSLGDWLGTGTIASRSREYRPFTEARTFARSLQLKNGNEWKAFTKSGKLPPDIPAKPSRVYKDKGWAGVDDWLGTGNISNQLKKFRPFKDARAYARRLGLKSVAEWRAFTKSGKLPPDIPADPRKVYIDKGWKGYRDWLGKK